MADTLSPEERLLIWDGPVDAGTVVILAHGAGAPMDTPFQTAIAMGLAEKGFRVVRFEFPYMARQRVGEGKRPPDREPVLLECWRDVCAAVRTLCPDKKMVIAGKSMGGRMATLLAAERPQQVCSVVALGYPFHPPGKPDAAGKRLDAIRANPLPMLVVQGERDTLGNRSFVDGVVLPPNVRVQWLEDGDHSFKPRKASGFTEAGHWHTAVEAVSGFLNTL